MRPMIVITLTAAMIAFMLAVLASRRAAAPPILYTPSDNSIFVAGATVSPYEFKWRHGGYMVRYPFRWRAADQFVVCLKEDDKKDFPCENSAPGASNDPPWVEAAANIPSATGLVGSRFSEATRTYTYTVDVLARKFLDKDLIWTAAACANATAGSCSYATPPHRFKILGRNLIANDIHEDFPMGRTLPLNFDFENSGRNDTGSFEFTWRVVQMMPDQSNNPRRDVNTMGIDANIDRVMLISTGTIVPIHSLPVISGGHDNSDVWGILVRNGFEQSNVETHAGLGPLSMDTFSQTFTITGPTIVVDEVTSLAMSLIVDPSSTLEEFDETDNVHVKEEDYIYLQ